MTTTYNMHVLPTPVDINQMHTAARFRRDTVHFPGDHLKSVTVNTDTSTHGLVDTFDPNNVTANVFVSTSVFNTLLGYLAGGNPQTVSVTCDDQNNVTDFRWDPQQHAIPAILHNTTVTASTVNDLNQFVHEAVPEVKHQLEVLHTLVTAVAKKLEVPLIPTPTKGGPTKPGANPS